MSLWLARVVASVGGLGFLPGPSGTWAALVAIPLAWGLHRLGGFPLLAVATAALGVAGYLAVRVEIVDGPDLDPGEIVVDEVVGMWLALWPLSAGLWLAGAAPHVFPWPGWVAGFLFFRLFDMVKLGPVGWAERRGGALAVMLDDVAAGLMAAACVAALAAAAHGWLR
jgi:phosphatidylglycerophosphatase A